MFRIKGRLGVLLLSIGLIFNALAEAQDLQQELLGVYKKFNENSFKMKVVMNIYYWNAKEPTIVQGLVKKDKEKYYSDFDNEIQLKNSSYLMMLNKEDKEITYMLPEQVEGKNKDLGTLTMMSDTTWLKNARLLRSTAAFKEYSVVIDDMGMNKMTLKITNNKELSEVSYYYEKTEESPVKKVVIAYKDVVFSPLFKGTDFSEKVFFNVVNGKAVLTAKYKSYKIINVSL